MSKIIKSIHEISWHRNGVSGVGFHAVRFVANGSDSIKDGERFLAIVFKSPGEVAVVSTDRLESCGVKFAGGNSWRGDWFEPELREAINEKNAGRVGPFSVPSGDAESKST